MIERHVPSAALMNLARLQSDILTPEQLRGHGFGRRPVERMLASGYWRPVGSGGLVLTRPDPPTWLALAWAGVLLGGDAARLGGTSALHAGGAIATACEPLVILVPHERQLRDRGPWNFLRERSGVRAPRTWGSPPRVSVEDAVLDAVAELRDEEIVNLVTSVVGSWRTTAQRLRDAMDRRGHLRHRPFLASLLAEVDDGARSELERRYLIDVERAHGLPEGRRQVRSGRAVRDVWYELYRLIVELDGRVGHDGTGRFRDMNRDNIATLGGDRTLRYGWFDVTGRKCAVAMQVGGLLMRHGWEGPLLRCPDCRNVPESELWVS